MLSVVLFFQAKQLTLFSFLWLSQNIKTYPSRNLKFVNGNYIYYYQVRIKSQTGNSLEIILNSFKYLTVSLYTEIFILAIASLSFTLVGIFCELAMLPDVYSLLTPRKKSCIILHKGTDVHIWKHIHQKYWTLYLSLD